MSSTRAITFVVAVNNFELLNTNFFASPCFHASHPHQVILQEGFESATKAYNDAISKSVNDIMVFAHQDVYFPEAWLFQLASSLDRLNDLDPQWGVLGCYGTTKEGQYRGYLFSSSQGFHGRPFENPTPVQTLDEFVLILRKSSGLTFDSRLPHFHLYGADICIAATLKGLRSYAIFAPCIHNTQQHLVLPGEFYQCCSHIHRTFIHSLPIYTTCIRITRFNQYVYLRRLQELYQRYVRRKTVGGRRVEMVQTLVDEFAAGSGAGTH